MNDLIKLILSLDTKTKANAFLISMFTPQELSQLCQRLMIVKLLKAGLPQREIAERLGVGIATVTRGSKEISDGKFEYIQA